MTRHLLEQHSGFSYKCLNCKKFVPRLKKHPGCNAGTASMRLFHRNTGKTGTEAQAMLDGYKSTMEQFFEETSRFARVPPQISPIKDPLPGRVNRLEGLYRNKPTTSFDSVPPKKKLRLETGTSHTPSMLVPTEEPNWSHDPVEIILLEPSQKELPATTSDEFPGVTFSPPVQVTPEEEPVARNLEATTEMPAAVQPEPIEATTIEMPAAVQPEPIEATTIEMPAAVQPEPIEATTIEMPAAVQPEPIEATTIEMPAVQPESAQVTERGDNTVEVPFSDELFQGFRRHLATLRYDGATPAVQPAPSDENVLQGDIYHKMFNHFQMTQEKRVTLNIGGQCFQTSKVTLESDPKSLFGMMMRDDCPFRPSGNTGRSYFLDRDPTHFKLILSYLRNGCHLDSYLLPNEKRYLLEILCEARFYFLYGLQELILGKLEKLFGSRQF